MQKAIPLVIIALDFTTLKFFKFNLTMSKCSMSIKLGMMPDDVGVGGVSDLDKTVKKVALIKSEPA